MAISITALQGLSTAQLKELRADYKRKGRMLGKQHRTRTANYSTDTLRTSNAVRTIDSIIRTRRINKRPLAEFKST